MGKVRKRKREEKSMRVGGKAWKEENMKIEVDERMMVRMQKGRRGEREDKLKEK